MAKRLDSVYRPGLRSPDWIKVKLDRTGDFVVGGWRPGARELGALLVGVPGAGRRLIYRGRVGGGISARRASGTLLRRLEPLRADAARRSPGDVPREDARGADLGTPRAGGRGASTATDPGRAAAVPPVPAAAPGQAARRRSTMR